MNPYRSIHGCYIFFGGLFIILSATAEPDSGRSTKIANGLDAFNYPSSVVLINAGGIPRCSGVLIGCDSVLTAAHCVCSGSHSAECQPGSPDLIDPGDVFVAMQNGPVQAVSALRVAPNYVWARSGDLALLDLSHSVEGIAPAPVNTLQQPVFSAPATLVGYGYSAQRLYDSGIKRLGQTTTESCASFPVTTPLSDAEHLCWSFGPVIGAPGEDSNACPGDSGAPLFIDSAGERTVAGIHWGHLKDHDCDIADYSAATNLFANRFWLQNTVSDLGVGQCGNLPSVGKEGTAVIPFEGELSVSSSDASHFFVVPEDTALLRVALNGVTASADLVLNEFNLYVKAGSPPGLNSYDCRPFFKGNYEVCEFADPTPGLWYAMAQRFFGPGGKYQLTATLFDSSASARDSQTRLINISTNGGVDARGMVAGFIVPGVEPVRVVVMGENAGALSDPELKLTDISGTIVLESNDDWQTHSTAAEVVSTLRSPAAPDDAAFAVTLLPGSYLVWLNGENGSSGTGLISVTEIATDGQVTANELHDFRSTSDSRLFNISTNGVVDARGMVAGFIVRGSEPKRFVMMGENAGSLSDAELRLTDLSGSIVLEHNDNWRTHATADEIVSSLRSPATLNDAAFAITLSPGTYLLWLTGKNDTTGVGIVSVTERPLP